MPGEIYKINDRIRAILKIKEVEGRGPQLMLVEHAPRWLLSFLVLRFLKLMKIL